MKLSSTTIAIAVLGAMSVTVSADPLTVYGKANVSFQSSDNGTSTDTEVKSNASRFGVKGDVELDNGMSAFYTFEWQVDLSDEDKEKNLSSRNQFVGIKGGFGEIALGRNDTMLKQSQGKVDLFGDYNADIKALWKGENRMSDTVTYKTPSINGFKLGVTYAAEDGNDATSVALMYGDSSLKKSNWYAAIALDSDMKGYDITRVTAQTKISDITLGAMYQTQKKDDVSADGYLVSAAYTMGNVTLNGQYQTLEDDDALSLGLDYKLGKSTKAFVWYSDFNFEAKNDENYTAVGLEHKF